MTTDLNVPWIYRVRKNGQLLEPEMAGKTH